MLSHRIFVYGTLKQGFRNFHINRGTRLPGEFITEQAFPRDRRVRVAVAGA